MPHHDKAYRLFTSFAVKELADVIMEVWRVSLWGYLRIDRVEGPQAQEGTSRVIRLLIHQKHMQAIKRTKHFELGDKKKKDGPMLYGKKR